LAIPPAFLDELRARVPLSDIVGRRIALKRAGREWKAPCPFHSEKTPSFYVNDQKGFFHCFGCGAHGDAVGFLMRNDGLAFPEAVEQLAGLAGLEMPRPEPQESEKYDRLKRLAEVLEAAAKWFEAQLRGSAGRDALQYLTGRGLDERTIAEFRLGYAPAAADSLRAALTGQGYDEADIVEVGLIRRPDDGRAPYGFFRNRVIFPVSDKRGRIVAFGGRILEGDGPKYVNSPEHALFHKGSVLYGLARARAAIGKGERPVVVEGYMDVIALQAAGIGGAVAPLGTALGEAQLAELWKTQDPAAARDLPPVLCFDGDDAGRRAAVRAVDRILPLLGPERSAAVAFMPRGDDPDSLVRRGGTGAVRQVLDCALPLIEALWEFATAGRQLATPEQRAALWAELDAQIRAMTDPQVQSLYRVELRRRFDTLFLPARVFGRRQRGAQPFAALGPRPSRVMDGNVLRARILLALMVNHPFLFEELGEIFAEMEVPVAWQQLHRAVLTTLSSGPLDAEALRVQLSTSGFGAEVADILGPATTEHAKFVRADALEDEVRAGWRDVWLRVHGSGLDRELAAALADPARGEDQALERISRLGERRVELVAMVGSGDTVEIADGENDLLRAAARWLEVASGRARPDESGGFGE
jgi:DNA primase